jgi:DNA-binding transcriptional MerR regulator
VDIDTRNQSYTILDVWTCNTVPKRERQNMLKTKKSRPDTNLNLTSRTFTSSEVSNIAGVSLRQLQWWDERKVVSPRHEGHKRVYSPEEVVEITVIAELRRKGFSLQKIRRVLRFLQREMGRRLGDVLQSESDLHLVTDGKSIFLEERNEKIIDLMKNAKQPMFLVCVTDQVRRLTEPARKPARGESAGTTRRARAV